MTDLRNPSPSPHPAPQDDAQTCRGCQGRGELTEAEHKNPHVRGNIPCPLCSDFYRDAPRGLVAHRMEHMDPQNRGEGNEPCEGWEGPCESTNAKRYHMNTAYTDEESNYATLCPDCQAACDDHWAEMWDLANDGRV